MTLRCPLLTKLSRSGKGEMFSGSTSCTTKQAKQDGFGARNKKLITGKGVICFILKQLVQTFLLFGWLIFFHPLTFKESLPLYLKCISFRQRIQLVLALFQYVLSIYDFNWNVSYIHIYCNYCYGWFQVYYFTICVLSVPFVLLLSFFFITCFRVFLTFMQNSILFYFLDC